jgi:hypothetical protein
MPRLPRSVRRSSSCAPVRAAAAAVLLVVAVGASPAAAQLSERITFDFRSGSTISLLGGTIVTPPDGTLDFARARVLVDATAPGVYVPGGAFVLDGTTIDGTVAKQISGVADIGGHFMASQVGSLSGVLAPGQDGGQFASSLALDLDVMIDCTGTGCSALGMPINDVGLSLLSIPFLPVTDLGVPGSARIETSIPIEIDGVLGTLDLVGVEVSRTFVPEPGTFALVAVGLGILAGRRRRAGAPDER